MGRPHRGHRGTSPPGMALFRAALSGICRVPSAPMRQPYQSPRAWYACVNLREAYCPPEIQARAVCLQGDIGAILDAL